jgi:hypothetical protein
MSPLEHDSRRVMLVGPVRDLVKRAHDMRATMQQADPGRQFYLGVEAAAEEVLHPELGCARAEGWLDRETRDFREGYMETQLLLAAAMTSQRPPPQIALPSPTR